MAREDQVGKSIDSHLSTMQIVAQEIGSWAYKEALAERTARLQESIPPACKAINNKLGIMKKTADPACPSVADVGDTSEDPSRHATVAAAISQLSNPGQVWDKDDITWQLFSQEEGNMEPFATRLAYWQRIDAESAGSTSPVQAEQSEAST